MKLVKSLLLGSAAGLLTVGAAQAADLPTRKAAPVAYVRVCDAYGAGFFFIPGTDTCLRVGGLVLAQTTVQPSSQLVSVFQPVGAAVGVFPAFLGGGVGAVPTPAQGRTINGREILTYSALGRLELDARTQSPFGTVRSFVRIDANFGSTANGTTGSLASSLGFNGYNVTAGPSIARELVFLNKAFIQFAGITAGRVQSFFDFYADAVNYAGLKGSNQTVWALAYTATFGGGFSGTISMEDPQSHRGGVAQVTGAGLGIGLTGIGAGGGAFAATGLTGLVGSARMPDIVGNLRFDQPWGAVQLSAALHQVRANLFPTAATTAGAAGAPAAYAFPVNTSSQLGYALQGGVRFDLDMLAPGDKLWLQATYARGSIGYVQGNNLAFVQGLNGTASYGVGISRASNSPGYTQFSDVDCVYTFAFTCDQSRAFAFVAALKHYWTPTVSSALFGQYYDVRYSQNARVPINPVTAQPSVGINNFREVRIGTNLVWTPIKNFDIGGEFTYVRYMQDRPFGLAPDNILQAIGLPPFRGAVNQYISTLRVTRAF